jgi:hypothetical protein
MPLIVTDLFSLALPIVVLLTYNAWFPLRWWHRVLCQWIGHDWCWLGITDVPYGAEEWQTCHRCGQTTCVFLPAWGAWRGPLVVLLGVPEFDPDEIPPVVTEVRARKSPGAMPLPSDGRQYLS